MAGPMPGENSAQTAGLCGIFAQSDLLEPHLFDLLFELTIFGAHAAKVKIVPPEVACAVLDPDQAALERSDGVHDPDTDQTRVFCIIAVALDLRRQAQNLQK